jgi:hypothetical protein
VNSTVVASRALTPTMSWLPIYAAIDAASDLTLAKPAQKSAIPWMVCS